MLFSSYEFVLVFLPLALFFFHLARCRFGGRLAMVVIVVLSLFFYGWWNPAFIILIIGSIFANFLFARRLMLKPSRLLLAIAISLNIATIGYFKYRNFFLENIELVSGHSFVLSGVLIPLGISFFTFQQIALLLDAHDQTIKHEPNLLEYAFFVLFFPQLIAGPIVLYYEMSPQYSALQEGSSPGLEHMGKGVFLFALGLFKKNALSDPLGVDVDRAFSMIADITMIEAWFAAVAFTVQIFLDFSSYADMAIGLGFMFGITLPANFHYPYRSTSMIEFWKRWHITMTRFFMMYVYSPLALGFARWSIYHFRSRVVHFLMASSIPLMLTFLLSGLWHGAAWKFVAFGAVNAVGLIINHTWKELSLPPLPRLLGWALTMGTVIISLIYFRAPDMADANLMITTMFDPSAIAVPMWLSGVTGMYSIPAQNMRLFPYGTPALASLLVLLLSVAIVLLAPGITQRLEPSPLSWKSAFFTAFLFVVGLSFAGKTTNFIYFQF